MAKAIQIGGDEGDDELGRALGSMFERAARKGASADMGPRGKRMPDDVAALELKLIAERHINGCPFKPGDLVTPRVGYNIRFAGSPHVVIEVFDQRREPARPHERGDLAPRHEMRVVCQVDGDFVPFFAESYAYEPYAGPVAKLD